MLMAEEGRENLIGSIEHTRKMLAFLKTLDSPSETASSLIRRYSAEVAAYDSDIRGREGRSSPTGSPGPEPSPSEFHDVAGANT
jgi:hypothetical protein